MPEDPIMLVSFLNLKLRDEYDSFDSLCRGMDADRDEIVNKLMSVGYKYNPATNQFR